MIHLPMDHPRIKQYIWDHGYIQKPSTKPYNLENPDGDPSIGQAEIVRKLFRNQRGGFFVEAGALDGETDSNTLYLETQLGWSGLLIEPSPSNFELLKKKHRKSWISNCCLATMTRPHSVIFEESFNTSQIVDDIKKSDSTLKMDTDKWISCQCFPLYSLLSSINVDTVDYLSLDVEGVEVEILETIPFDKIFIKTISVEFSHVPCGKEGLQRLMEDKGYVLAYELARPIEPRYANDFIFVHQSCAHLIPKDLDDLTPEYMKP